MLMNIKAKYDGHSKKVIDMRADRSTRRAERVQQDGEGDGGEAKYGGEPMEKPQGYGETEIGMSW